ncbi:CRISPR-associated endonuclease/helicase Cas3 [Runella defluvii]|uniref:CRISPR-associated endonuclease/helicase Cas3 n=1 Tax=Runella defluvii TaxID=370973 RepID=A0A7W5ZL74_9BACT|nr:CRISPR-associated helicase Cas3' [Runella defluvii]MBB3837837.1 CRISPR-associated endonuclease/helicase Cas3 [Runella defluvii]
MNIEEYYKKTFSDGIVPYSYQLAVAKKLLEGKNVILQVPTGAGKTWASIMPFLYARELGLDSFPEKMIYSLPLRTLTNSIYEDVFEVLKKNGYDEGEIKRQTGEYSDDPYFEKNIIFSTIDQTLSNFLCFPLPLSPRQANINAGALIGSYLVFDEFHLLDSELSMATTIGTLKMLGNLCRCCIMTATLSEDFMCSLKSTLDNYEIITLDDFEVDKSRIRSLLPTENKKTVCVLDTTLNAENVIENHKDKTIIICNRVENAQKIYYELIEKKEITDNLKFKNAEIICLHSRFFDSDRKAKENKLKNLFGKNATDTNVILIATQVIEAGMDISCSVMHTEISPISSFLQRVGRNARFADEIGKVFIYSLLEVEEKERIKLEPENKEDKTEIAKLNNKYLPYDKDLCEKTFTELKKYQTLDGNILKKLIEAVLGETEKDLIKNMSSGQAGGFNQEKIKQSWKDCKKNNYRHTIRDIQSVEVILINENQKNEVAKYPFRFQSIGMYKWSLVSWLNKIMKGEGVRNYDIESNTLAWTLEENTFLGEMNFENDEDVKFTLQKLTTLDKIPNRLFVNAYYLGYDEGIGLNWQYESTFDNSSPRSVYKEKKDDFKPLEKDTFYQHNMGLIGAFEQEFLGDKRNKLDFVFKQLADYIDMSELEKDNFIELIKWMIVLHDYGKLNEKWQVPMQKYQALKDTNWELEVLGHTDYDSKDEKDLALAKQAGLNQRPPHAGVGAYAIQEVLDEYYDNAYLKSGISMAIAKHHSPDLSKAEYPTFKISEFNYNVMRKLLAQFELDFDLEKNDTEGRLDGFILDDSDFKQYVIYLFFVRILRLCDQKATDNFKKYFNEN